MLDISSINSQSGNVTSTTGTSSVTNSSASLGKDDFLKLLVAQMSHQDPTNPMDASQLSTQLAQFASVEQLTQLNTAVAAQSSDLQLSTAMTKTNLGASLIGRTVVAEGKQVHVPASGTASVRIKVGGAGGNGTLKVIDASGRTVATKDLGPVQAGRQTVDLPSGIAAGDYTYSVDVTTGSGTTAKSVAVTTYTTGVVDGLRFDSTGILLSMGSITIPLDSVAEIEPTK